MSFGADWRCACGYANLDVRNKCRNCGSDNPDPIDKAGPRAPLPLPLRVEVTPGLPAAGSLGQYLGYDATGAMWLLRWSGKYAEWQALGFERDLGPEFPILRRGRDLPALIIGHVKGPDYHVEARHAR